MRKRKAFTLVEIMIAMFLMTIVILSIFMLNQNANKTSMNAYYEMLAFSLAREPIEIYRGFGFDTLIKICKNSELAPKQLKTGEFYPVVSDFTDNESVVQYPDEAETFVRQIKLEPIPSLDNADYVKITVTVAPAGSTEAEIRFSKRIIQLESIVMKTPKW